MLHGTAVVCMSSLEWEFSWHPNQEIMYRLGEAGNRVLYVETTGVRAARLRDWHRMLARMRTALGAGPRLQKTHPNVTVYAPLVLPFPHAPLAHSLNSRIVLRRINAWRRSGTESHLILWAFLPSPMTLAMIDHLRPSAVVFHYMGDAKASRPLPGVARAERALLQRSDLVFANSLSLLEKARQFTPNAHLFRAGVDVEAFQAAAEEAAVPPPDLQALAHPIVGYTGSIHEWLDLNLLGEVARGLPLWQFVMVGAVMRDIGSLRGIPNIHWLGPRAHRVLPHYIRHFDACMIPYALDPYTASAYPGKLNEYLALGKPVVATPLPELIAYNREFGDIVHLADAAGSFREALHRATGEDAEARRPRYVATARANSWKAQLDAMSALITERLLMQTPRPPAPT